MTPMHPQEIDKIFLHKNYDAQDCFDETLQYKKEQIDESSDYSTIKTVKEYINNAKKYSGDFMDLHEQANEKLKVFRFYSLKLNKLSSEIEEIEQKNDFIELQIKNKALLFEELKNLLVSIEIKPEHFTNLNSFGDSNSDLSTVNISLNVLKSFYSDFDILIIKDLKDKISKVLKTFIKNFLVYFQKNLNNFESESKGELKIHTKLYEEMKKYEFVFDYCKENDNESFTILTRKYLTTVKNLYEKEFEVHLNYLLKAIKNYKNKANLKTKLEKIISVLFESFFVILRCENNFVKNLFFDSENFVNEFLKNVFFNVFEFLFTFIFDCFKISNLFTINALFKSKSVKSDFEDFNISIINDFKSEIIKIIDNYKNLLFKEYSVILKLESNKKSFKRIVDDIKNNAYIEMNNEVIEFFIVELKKKKEKGKIESCLFKLELVCEILDINNHSKRNELESYKNIIEKDLEKEVIGYVFAGDNKTIKMRCENILDLMKDMFGKNETFYRNTYQLIKNILYDNATLETKGVIENVFA